MQIFPCISPSNDIAVGGGARDRNTALARVPEGEQDVDQPHRVDLRLDEGSAAPRQARRQQAAQGTCGRACVVSVGVCVFFFLGLSLFSIETRLLVWPPTFEPRSQSQVDDTVFQSFVRSSLFDMYVRYVFRFSDRSTRRQVFAKNMEKAVIETVEAGHMTKDLAICVHGWNVTEDQYLMTEAFMDEIKVRRECIILYSLQQHRMYHRRTGGLVFNVR